LRVFIFSKSMIQVETQVVDMGLDEIPEVQDSTEALGWF